MIRQWWWKRKKMWRGLLRTRASRRAAYDPESWWDRSFYQSGLADAKTIAANKHEYVAAYHYRSMETIILADLFNRDIDLTGARVFDIGSGAGHWIDFYRELGAGHVTGIDISEQSVDYLRDKYRDAEGVSIRHGAFEAELRKEQAVYDAISAIGVMFHLVDDASWANGLAAIAGALRPGGTLVVGGHFGLFDGIDVQWDRSGAANKRLRSRFHWRRELRRLGLSAVRIHWNPAYLFVKDTIPENNVLIARR